MSDEFTDLINSQIHTILNTRTNEVIERLKKLEEFKNMLFSEPGDGTKYIPTRFEKWQTEQMNKDYLVFKEAINGRIEELEKCKEKSMVNHIFSCSYTDEMRVQLEDLMEHIEGLESGEWIIKPIYDKLKELGKRIDSFKSEDIKLYERIAELEEMAKYDRYTLEINGVKEGVKTLEQKISGIEWDEESLKALWDKTNTLSAVIKEILEWHPQIKNKLEGEPSKKYPATALVVEALMEKEEQEVDPRILEVVKCGDCKLIFPRIIDCKKCGIGDVNFHEEQEYVSHIDPITLVEVQLKKEKEVKYDPLVSEYMKERISRKKEEQEAKQTTSSPSISITPSGYLNASSMKLPEFIKKGLREIEEEQEEKGEAEPEPTCTTCNNFMDTGETFLKVERDIPGGLRPGEYYERSVWCSEHRTMLNTGCWKEKEVEKEAEPVIDYGYKNIFAVDHGVKQGKEIMKKKLIAEIICRLTKLTNLNYRENIMEQINKDINYYEAKLKK